MGSRLSGMTQKIHVLLSWFRKSFLSMTTKMSQFCEFLYVSARMSIPKMSDP